MAETADACMPVEAVSESAVRCRGHWRGDGSSEPVRTTLSLGPGGGGVDRTNPGHSDSDCNHLGSHLLLPESYWPDAVQFGFSFQLAIDTHSLSTV
jgi:hypothetical protein